VNLFSLLVLVNIPLTPDSLNLLFNASFIAGWAITVGGAVTFAYLGFKSRFKVDTRAIKFPWRKVSFIAVLVLIAVCLSNLLTVPLAQSETVAVTGYYLATPLPIADWYMGKYASGYYFAINGSNWNNLVAVEPWQPSPPWASFAENYTALTQQVLASLTYGTIYMKEVPFNLALMSSIPANVQVIDNINGVSYTYINSASSLDRLILCPLVRSIMLVTMWQLTVEVASLLHHQTQFLVVFSQRIHHQLM